MPMVMKTYTNTAPVPSAITKAEYQEYLESDRWKKLRARCKVRAHDFCQGEGCENLGTEAHHTTYANRGGDFDAELGDLVWLCRGCHQKAYNLRGTE
jgi:5-methylcytosine-specific restriction endonuclease McrA